tara:strand:+ start:367 stop:1002 length:636 start_codon:yes stop_codon:yes gene_type:complete
MGTLKVDNLQKRDGTSLITDGVAQTNLLSETALRNAGVGQIKLNTTDITSSTATLVFDNSLITSNYDKYIMEYTMLKPVTDATYFRPRFSADNGSSFITGTYNFGYSSTRMGAASHTGSGSTKSDYAVTDFQWGNEANTAGHGKYIFEGFNDSNAYISIQHIYVVHNFNSQWYYVREAWGLGNVVNPNYAEFSFTSGNIADGTFTLYGVTK